MDYRTDFAQPTDDTPSDTAKAIRLIITVGLLLAIGVILVAAAFNHTF